MKSFQKFKNIVRNNSQAQESLVQQKSIQQSLPVQELKIEDQNESFIFNDEIIPLVKKKILVDQNSQNYNYFSDNLKDDYEEEMIYQEYLEQKIDEQGKNKIEDIRDYQKEIFMNSHKQNSIVYLETGTGKTMVATMLIYYFFKKQKQEKQKKKIIFVANTVQLIEQQYVEIMNNLQSISEKMENDREIKEVLQFGNKNNYRREFDSKSHITKAHGHFKGKENLKQQERFGKSKWESIKEKFEIIVMMGQVLLNGLRRGFLHINEIEVIIFDECHHSRGDHPYNLIMYEFYHFYKRRNSKDNQQEVVQLPKIYGLTASPVLDVDIKPSNDDLTKKITELCSNFDAQFAPYDIQKSKNFIKETSISIESYSDDSAMEKRANQVLQEKINGEKWIHQIEEEGEDYAILLNFYKKFKKFKDDHFEDLDKINKLVVSELEKIICCDSLQLDAQLGKYAISLFFKDVNTELQKIKSFQHNQLTMAALQRIINEETQKFVQAYTKCERNVSKKFLFLYDQLKNAMTNDQQKFKDYKDQIEYHKKTFHQEEKQKKLEQYMKQNQSMVLIFVQEKIIIKYLRLVLEKWIQDENENYPQDDKLFRYQKVVCLTGQSNVYDQKKKLLLNNIFDSSEFAKSNDFQKAQEIYENLNRKIDYQDDDESNFDDLDRLKMQINDHQHTTQRLTLVVFDFEVQKQTENIEAFRKKELQIILSTSVTEEGFDIPSCNLVISFNKVSNLKSFVQIKGRARKVNSKYLIMAKDENQKQEFETDNQLYKELIEQIKQMAPSIKKKDVQIRKNYQYKIVKQTGAILNTNWSVMLFHGYANYLHYEIDWNFRGPYFYFIHTINVGYICQIILPPSASSERRYFSSSPQQTKEDAKKDACFKAVIILYRQFKIFDEHLRTHLQVINQKQNGIQEALYEDKNDKVLVKILEKYTKSEYDEKQKYKKMFYDSVMGLCMKSSFFVKSLFDNNYKIQVYLFKFNNQQSKIPKEGFENNQWSELGFIHSTDKPITQEMRYYLQIHKEDVYADMVLQYETTISQDDYKRLMLINRYLNSVALSKDIEFYAEYTQIPMNPLGKLFKEKKKVENQLFDYKFDNQDGFNSMITLLKPSEKYQGRYEINYDHIKVLEGYINYMSEVYKIRNKTRKDKKSLINGKDFEDQKVNPFYDCINFFDSNQGDYQRYQNAKEKLVLQNITSGKHLNRFIYQDSQNYRELREQYSKDPSKTDVLNKIEKSKRQTEYEEINFKIQPNHMVLRVQIFDKKYLRKQVNHYLQRNEFLQEEEDTKLGDFKHFPHQFTIFPMNIDLLMKLKIFHLSFLYQIRDTFAIHHFQQFRLPKMFNKSFNSIKDFKESYEVDQKPHFIVEYHQQLLDVMKKDEKYYQICKKYLYQQNQVQNVNQQDTFRPTFPSIQQSFQRYLQDINKIKLTEMIKALTSLEYVVNNKDQSLERYEFLGDTVLKCLASTQIYFQYQTKMEKYLHVYRTQIIFNKNLSQCAIKKKLFKYILAAKMDHAQPLGIKFEAEDITEEDRIEQELQQSIVDNQQTKILDEYDLADQRALKINEDGVDQFNQQPVFIKQTLNPFSRQIKGKTLADTLESLVGVFFWENKDVNHCQFLLFTLGVLCKPDLTFKHTFELNLRFSQLKNPFYLHLKGVEEKIGYTFQNINLLFQAFTLPDFETICSQTPIFKDKKIRQVIELTDQIQENPILLYENSKESLQNASNDIDDQYFDILKSYNLSNQRLEFLGDAVLDLIVVEYLFTKFKSATPGQLTSQKTQLVQNRTLCLANLESGFYHYIIGNIQKNQQDIENLLANKEMFKEDISLMYNTNYNQTLIKTLGDIIESLVCAIFIDNNLNYQATKKIVLTFMSSFLEEFTSERQILKNPQSQVTKVLNQYFPNAILKEDKNDISDGKTKFYICSELQEDIIYSEVYAIDILDALDKIYSTLDQSLKKSKKK